MKKVNIEKDLRSRERIMQSQSKRTEEVKETVSDAESEESKATQVDENNVPKKQGSKAKRKTKGDVEEVSV